MENLNKIETPRQGNGTPPPSPGVKKIDTSKWENYQPKIDLRQNYDVGLDGGYSSWKIMFNNQLTSVPTAIHLDIDTGISYGESNTYVFENETLLVGAEAVNESFTTLDYKFKYKYDPLIMVHILYKLGALDLSKPEQSHLTLRVGLALGDWKNKDNYLARLRDITIDGRRFIFPNIKIGPQGAGVYLDSLVRLFDNNHPETCSVIDLGYNTVNFLQFENGKPQKQYCRSYMGHGVSSIIKSFTDWLENEFGMPFSEQEAIKIFLKEKFIYNGENQTQVKDIIYELKSNFIKKLKNSVLIKEKKLLSTSEVVIFAGGGAELIKNVQFPPNVRFAADPMMYSNVRGFMLF